MYYFQVLFKYSNSFEGQCIFKNIIDRRTVISLHFGRAEAERISCIARILEGKQWLRWDFMNCHSDISGVFIFHVERGRLEEIL